MVAQLSQDRRKIVRMADRLQGFSHRVLATILYWKGKRIIRDSTLFTYIRPYCMMPQLTLVYSVSVCNAW